MTQDIDSTGPLRRVLFVCCDNAARSQIAEAVLNAKYGSRFLAYSAGIEPSGAVDPLALKALNEVGIDISHKRTKSVDDLMRDRTKFDFVVTTCYESKQGCPYFPAPEQVHARFDDPKLTLEGEDGMQAMRRVRDQIIDWVDWFFGPRASLLELQKEQIG